MAQKQKTTTKRKGSLEQLEELGLDIEKKSMGMGTVFHLLQATAGDGVAQAWDIERQITAASSTLPPLLSPTAGQETPFLSSVAVAKCVY